MSIHSEVQNLMRNKSGNACLSIHSRSGEQEEGNTYFDLTASRELNPQEQLESQGQAQARMKFFKAFFKRLRGWLTKEEFEFVKLRFTTDKPESVICAFYGLRLKDVRNKINEQVRAHREELEELSDASEWDEADVFLRVFNRIPMELINEKDLLERPVRSPRGLENLVIAQSRRENYLQHDSDRYYQRKVYMRGYERGKANAMNGALADIYKIVEESKTARYIYSADFIEKLLACFGVTFKAEKDKEVFLNVVEGGAITFDKIMSSILAKFSYEPKHSRYERYEKAIFDDTEEAKQNEKAKG